MLSTHHQQAEIPGPRGWPIVGNTLQFAFDPLGFPLRCACEFGGITYLNVRGLATVLVVEPEYIETVLIQQKDKFILDRLSKGLADALGNSILVSDGAAWFQQRRVLQPAFHLTQIQSYIETMIRLTDEHIAEWQGHDQFEIDVFPNIARLMLKIVCETLLGTNLIDAVQVIEDYLEAAMHHILGIAGTGLRLPLSIPTPANLTCRRAEAALDEVIYRLIQERRDQETDSPDMLSFLFQQQRLGGESMTDKQLRDEIVTMILVGHETSALAITFSLWLLTRHPAAQDKARDEVETILGKGAFNYTHFQQLSYLNWVFNETLRLYPPVWAMGREALEDVQVGNYTLSVGTQVLLSPWVSHYNPRYFPEPERFFPERWHDADNLPQFAYFPFGGGPRVCLGARYARLESLIVLTTILQKFRLVSVSPDADNLELMPSVTLRPRKPIRLVLGRGC